MVWRQDISIHLLKIIPSVAWNCQCHFADWISCARDRRCRKHSVERYDSWFDCCVPGEFSTPPLINCALFSLVLHPRISNCHIDTLKLNTDMQLTSCSCSSALELCFEFMKIWTTWLLASQLFSRIQTTRDVLIKLVSIKPEDASEPTSWLLVSWVCNWEERNHH